MRLLDRYLLRELLVPLAYCLCGFLIFWVAFDLFSELNEFQSKKLLLRDMVEYYLVTTPQFLVIVLPIALLLASLYALTSHARHHEIIAIRAAGVSLWRLCLPYWGVGFLLSVAALAVNECWAPGSDEKSEEILARRAGPKAGSLGPNRVRDLGFTNARHGRIWKIGVYDAETTEMLNPKVFWTQADGSRLWLEAERACYTNDVWTFYRVTGFKETTNSDLIPVLQTNIFPVPAFTETPEEIRSEIKITAGLSLRSSKAADIPIVEILNYLRLHPQPSRSDAAWVYTKLQGRYAAPWTCLVVVLIAIPFGTASGRRNVFVGVASSILICFGYFVLQQLCLALGTGGYTSPWLAAWLPNLTFGGAGLWMISRVR